MIFRPLNIVGFVAAALAGLHLYTTKHEAALLDRELRSIARSIDEANERTQTLQAEWAWLNEPERLRGVAQRHLSLEPMQPSQFIRLNEAERRLPAVVAYDGPTALFAAREPTAPPGEAVSLALLPQIAPAVQLARAVPVEPAPVAPPPPPAAPPIALELPEALPREAEPPVAVRAPAPAPTPHPAEPRTTTTDTARPSAPAPRPRPASRPATDVAALPAIAAPRPAMPVVASAAPPPARRTVSSLGAPMVTQVATAAPRRAEPAPAAVGRSSLGGASIGGSSLGGSSLGGSALGGSRPMLAPPVPFGSANAATLNGGGLR
ncbi:hypothetical protein GCM10011504_17200 [Siccirubricoccus deserti]|uniref:Cell division protein FtsL n=1 Tax=Siccirubricoccus deserti TaxID=2013562 RepID=A0A9X0UD31_9PROT|nr:hypothetical protein [Siccirubricoccus deserti]MBC4015939.1 hypothetical protein [Siccirubricoccus deserti]GGC39320.1 hypothetical protein GCM10011504_17200 [Siccirubricoccus deserti]